MGDLAIGMWMALGYMSLSSTAEAVCSWLQDLIACAQIMSWLVICTTYLRFYYALKKHGYLRGVDYRGLHRFSLTLLG